MHVKERFYVIKSLILHEIYATVVFAWAIKILATMYKKPGEMIVTITVHFSDCH